MTFSTQCLEIGPYASYDIDVTKEDKLYRTALAYSVNDMIESYNFFVTNNLRGILIGVFTNENGFTVNVKDIEVKFPQFKCNNGHYWMTPFIARQTGSNYMCDIYIHYVEVKTIHGTHNNQAVNTFLVDDKLKTKKLGSFHCLVGSKYDITTIKPHNFRSVDEWKAFLCECPASFGCFTINNGNEKIIAIDQKLRTNIKVSYMTGGDNPLIETRITCMHNSKTTLIRVQIGKNLPNVKIILQFLKGRHFPLYLIFYLVFLLHNNNFLDKELFKISIFENMISDFAPPEEKNRIIAYLASSRLKFETLFIKEDINGNLIIDEVKIRQYIHHKLGSPKYVATDKAPDMYSLKTSMDSVNTELFTQCKSYREKIINLCDISCQTVRCAIGTREFDSRDKLSNQKGDSFIRMLAQYATDTLVPHITLNGSAKDFNYGKSDRKDVIVEARKTETLNSALAETCKMVNRVDQRTNSVTLREVSQDTIPNICPAKTPEGITCGLNKQKSALSHISDNQEYNYNRRLPIDDLFEPYIQYISNEKSEVYKYKLALINPNGQMFNLFYGTNNTNITDNIFVSLRILNIFKDMVEEERALYYIDSTNIIYVKFTFQCVQYQYQTYLGGILYVNTPVELAESFSIVASKIINPNYKVMSLPNNNHPECKSKLGFKNEDNNSVHYISIDNKPIYISKRFIEILKKSKYKYIKIEESDNEYIIVIPTNYKLVKEEFIHWTNVKCSGFIPLYLKEIIKNLLCIINEYISTIKTKVYSSSFSFNGNIIISPYNNSFYPSVIWVNGYKLVNYLRNKRRIGELPYDTVSCYDEIDMNVGFFDDPGRLMSPMLVVDSDGDLIIDKLDSWKRFNGYDYNNSKKLINSLYREGSLELIDAREMDLVLLPIDIQECRNISKLRKFLNNINIDELPSSIFRTINSTNTLSEYYRNEDIMTTKVHGNEYDIEFSLKETDQQTITFEQNGEKYYGEYVINRNIYYPTTNKIFKLIPPENPILRDGYHMIIFKDNQWQFITKDMDPETDDINIYLSNKPYKINYLDFSKSKELYIDRTCTVLDIKTFTRKSGMSNKVLVVQGEIISEKDLVDTYFYINKDGKYVVPDEYNFEEDQLTAIFEKNTEKIYRYIPNTNIEVEKEKPKNKDENNREAKLYISTIRRYIDDLDVIPDEYEKTTEEYFRIISKLKINITEFGVKKIIHIIRKYLNENFKFTHCLIDPNQAYSFIANFVPKADSNPGPRFSYQCSMGVQAMGVGNVIRYKRFETSVKSLIAPMEHSFETIAELPLMQVMMPVTQNFVFIVGSNFKGFEDPVIMSRSALEKYGRYEKEVCIKIVETGGTKDFSETVTYPTTPTGDIKTGHIFRHLQSNGLPILGSRIQVGDVIVGRTKIINTPSGIKRVDSSFKSAIGTEGIVTSIQIIGSENSSDSSSFRTIIIKLAQRHKQQPGDKLAARFSQKGTIADIIGQMINYGDARLTIVDDCLMPYVTSGPNKGLRADIVFNPASFPSRMTCGLTKEILTSKAALYLQEKIDASNFHKLFIEYYKEALYNNSLFEQNEHLDMNGNEIMSHSDGEIIIDSTTGKPMKFFIGIVAYQFLKHHVVDKETSRDRGSLKQITHQPDEGRHVSGGQRFGEMERDTLLSHGASGVLFDRFMKASDGYIGVYCYKCKQDSSISQLKSKICQLCGTAGSLVSVEEPRIFKVFRHQMAAIGLNILENLKPIDDFQIDIVKSNRAEIENNNEI
jgi:DNA-directed RNA polymerase beta subunit